MFRRYVPKLCSDAMFRRHVPTQCSDAMFRRHVPTQCSDAMFPSPRQNLTPNLCTFKSPITKLTVWLKAHNDKHPLRINAEGVATKLTRQIPGRVKTCQSVFSKTSTPTYRQTSVLYRGYRGLLPRRQIARSAAGQFQQASKLIIRTAISKPHTYSSRRV